MSYVRELGRKIMRNVLTSADAALTAIREKIFGGIADKAKNAAQTTKEGIEKGAKEVSGLASKIFRTVGGGKRN